MAVARPRSVHPLLDAALCHKPLLQFLYIGTHHPVRLVAKGEQQVRHLLVVHPRHKGSVGAVVVVRVAEVAQFPLTFAVNVPQRKVMRVQVVVIVGAKFLQTSARHIHQFNLHLRTRLPVLATLHDVLLARTSRLHHLVHRPVAMSREETPAKLHRQLIDGIALLIEIQVLPHHRLLQHLTLRVILHSFNFFVCSSLFLFVLLSLS